jgi:hypothetical protein
MWIGSRKEVEGQMDIGEDKPYAEKHRMTGMKKDVPKSVDEYIAAQREAVRPRSSRCAPRLGEPFRRPGGHRVRYARI